MAKVFVEFKQEDQEATLELSAYALSPEEHAAVLVELEAFESSANESLANAVFDFTYIDADSIRGTIRGDYGEVAGMIKQLRNSGWTWNE